MKFIPDSDIEILATRVMACQFSDLMKKQYKEPEYMPEICQLVISFLTCVVAPWTNTDTAESLLMVDGGAHNWQTWINDITARKAEIDGEKE